MFNVMCNADGDKTLHATLYTVTNGDLFYRPWFKLRRQTILYKDSDKKDKIIDGHSSY